MYTTHHTLCSITFPCLCPVQRRWPCLYYSMPSFAVASSTLFVITLLRSSNAPDHANILLSFVSPCIVQSVIQELAPISSLSRALYRPSYCRAIPALTTRRDLAQAHRVWCKTPNRCPRLREVWGLRLHRAGETRRYSRVEGLATRAD